MNQVTLNLDMRKNIACAHELALIDYIVDKQKQLAIDRPDPFLELEKKGKHARPFYFHLDENKISLYRQQFRSPLSKLEDENEELAMWLEQLTEDAIDEVLKEIQAESVYSKRSKVTGAQSELQNVLSAQPSKKSEAVDIFDTQSRKSKQSTVSQRQDRFLFSKVKSTVSEALQTADKVKNINDKVLESMATNPQKNKEALGSLIQALELNVNTQAPNRYKETKLKEIVESPKPSVNHLEELKEKRKKRKSKSRSRALVVHSLVPPFRTENIQPEKFRTTSREFNSGCSMPSRNSKS